MKSVYINNLIKLYLFLHQFESNFFTLNCAFKLFRFHQNFMSIRKNFWELSLNAIRNNLKLLLIDRAIDSNCHKCKRNINMSSFTLRWFPHWLCCHIYFSCSHHKQLNSEFKSITSAILLVHKQVPLRWALLRAKHVRYYMVMFEVWRFKFNR